MSFFVGVQVAPLVSGGGVGSALQPSGRGEAMQGRVTLHLDATFFFLGGEGELEYPSLAVAGPGDTHSRWQGSGRCPAAPPSRTRGQLALSRQVRFFRASTADAIAELQPPPGSLAAWLLEVAAMDPPPLVSSQHASR
ncbi:hypothetical protein BC828DRAFT_378139 [Blastocladiella britannica]|nr:hypothetical protein BC828DRAFT_378139 [Blastocladiella britannica]